MRPLCLAAASVLAAAASVLPASASWNTPGSGLAAARAHSMPAGATPTASASGRSVTVSWEERELSGGEPVGGYVVVRYDALGVVQTTLAGCAGVVVGLSCTEANVPIGTWRYAVRPASSAWRGAESAQSLPVLVTGL